MQGCLGGGVLVDVPVLKVEDREEEGEELEAIVVRIVFTISNPSSGIYFVMPDYEISKNVFSSSLSSYIFFSSSLSILLSLISLLYLFSYFDY
jgi:hypothetical protein